ncbi:MAG: nucleoside diphosphate kinase regulator [Geobacteraceae bacterium]|jgi:regulator of nucleoside diphosphate kinase|nr:nucleoside diphosphate kinase regulator [Geobacteraceae bacterium]
MKKNIDAKMIYITEYDMTRLEEVLAIAAKAAKRDFKHLEELTKELMKAEIVESTEIPSNVITMNSKVLFDDLENNTSKEYILVFPREADIEQNKVSVLSPIGTAMLGCRVGHVIKIKTPTGERRMKVGKILYQPEKAGDYHL